MKILMPMHCTSSVVTLLFLNALSVIPRTMESTAEPGKEYAYRSLVRSFQSRS
jgi:hypothetical protein